MDFPDSFLLTTLFNEEMREWILLVLTGISLHNELSIGLWISWSVLDFLSWGLCFAEVVLDQSLSEVWVDQNKIKYLFITVIIFKSLFDVSQISNEARIIL